MKRRKPRKDGKYIVNVSFCEHELDLLEYADVQGSFTSYVKRLIREDKNKSNNTTALELLLNNNDLIKALTENKKTSIHVDKEEIKEKEEVDKDAILKFLEQD